MIGDANYLEIIFRTILDLSVMGSVVILLVLLSRNCLKNVPRIFSYTMWMIPAIRLLIPISFQGIWGVTLQNGKKVADVVAGTKADRVIGRSYEAMQSGNRLSGMSRQGQLVDGTGIASSNVLSSSHSFLYYVSIAWAIGVAVILLVSLIQYLRLKKRLDVSVCKEKGVYINDSIPTAFVFGIFAPRIYLPSSLEEAHREMIVLHERTHLRRRDHLVKLCGFLILCVHWFNPMVWVGYHFFVQDMEMSCDEAVLRGSEGIRTEYATALLQTSAGGMGKLFLPAFGQGNTKSRIRNVMTNMKTKRSALIGAGILVVGVTVVLLLNLPNQFDSSTSSKTAKKPVTTSVELSFDGYYELEDKKGVYEYGKGDFVPNLMLQDGKKFNLQFAPDSYHFEGTYSVDDNMLVLTDKNLEENFYFALKEDLNLEYDKKRSSGILATSSMGGAIHEMQKGNLNVFKKMGNAANAKYSEQYETSSGGEAGTPSTTDSEEEVETLTKDYIVE